MLAEKKLPANVREIREVGSAPGLGRYLGGGHGNPLLENPMHRGAWWTTVSLVAQSLDTTEIT